MNFFQKLLKNMSEEDEDEIIQSMCQKLRIEKHPSGSLIVEEGDESNESMYLVAYGQCCVCIRDTKDIDEVNIRVNKKLKLIIDKYGKPVQLISQGEAFGEIEQLALLAPTPEEAKRMATVFALKDSYLIVLTRDNYLMSLSKNKKFNTKQSRNVDKQYFKVFLDTFFPFLNNLSQQLKQYFYLNIIEQQIIKGQKICQEGKQGSLIYILVQGTARITQKVIDDNQQSHNLMICIVEQNNLLGEEIVFNKQKKYEYTVQITSSNAEVLQLSHKLVHKFPYQILQNLKEQWRKKSITRIEIAEKLLNQQLLNQYQKKNKVFILIQYQKQIYSTINDIENSKLQGSMQNRILNYNSQRNQLTQKDFFQLEENYDNKKFTLDIELKVKNAYSQKKKQKQLIEYKTAQHQFYARQLYKKDKTFKISEDQELSDLYELYSKSRKQDICKNEFEKFIGRKDELIQNKQTNRFFTISKHIVLNSEQNSEDNSNKSSFASNSGFSVRDLDLGYMDDFYKNQQFRLIQLGIIKPNREKKALYEKLAEIAEQKYENHSSNQQLHPKIISQTPGKLPIPSHQEASRNLYYISANSNLPSTLNSKHLTNIPFDDPYAVNQSENTKIRHLNRKIRRLNIVNRRIKNQFEMQKTI